MTYAEFRSSIQSGLRGRRNGATWSELRDSLRLPYRRPCPEWTRQLEKEIGLCRRRQGGREMVWLLPHEGRSHV